MTDEQQQIPFLRPEEVCKQLGVNYKVLQYMRRMGKIEGVSFGNLTLYTQEQVNNARLERDKPGPKKGSKRGRKQSGDEGTGDAGTSNISSSVASVCDFHQRHHVADLVGV
jgi:hypothetical protein